MIKHTNTHTVEMIGISVTISLTLLQKIRIKTSLAQCVILHSTVLNTFPRFGVSICGPVCYSTRICARHTSVDQSFASLSTADMHETLRSATNWIMQNYFNMHPVSRNEDQQLKNKID